MTRPFVYVASRTVHFADEFDTQDADLEWTKDDDPFIKLLTETHEEESSED